jgi:hypothetical protein
MNVWDPYERLVYGEDTPEIARSRRGQQQEAGVPEASDTAGDNV